MKKKPKILLYWGYHRKAWTLPFEKLSDNFELVFIFHFNKTQEISPRPDLRIEYFSNYSSLPELLDRIRPDKLVFIGLDGLMPFLLNDWAHRKGIKTIIVQHGFLYKLADQLLEFEQEKAERKKLEFEVGVQSDKKYNASILIRSIDLRNFSFFFAAWRSRRSHKGKSEHEWLLNFQNPRRKASKYLLFAPYFANLYQERDHVSDYISFIGNHEFETVFKTIKSQVKEEDYFLLIDQPLFHAFQKGKRPKYDKESANSFYLNLAKTLSKLKLKLVIKLHPYSYNFRSEYPEYLNIEYQTEVNDLPMLIARAKCVGGFYSTLLLPVIPLKQTVLFEITGETTFLKDLREYDICSSVPIQFEQKDLEMALTRNRKPENVSLFVEEFLCLKEESCLDRLKSGLLD